MNQKSLDKKKTSEIFEGVNSTLHQAFIGAVERDKEPKKISACCNAEVATANSGLVGETNYYICTKCHNDCDVLAEPKELEWEEKTYKFIKNILLDAEEKKVPHPVLISQIFSLLTQQRTELLKLVNKAFEETVIESESCDYDFYEKLNNLLNKKDEN